MRELIKKIVIFLLRFQRCRSWASLFCRWYNIIYDQASSGLTDTISEIRLLQPRPSPATGYRLNLLIPTLAERHVYGGIATALKFFEAMAPEFTNLRIIVLDSTANANDNIAPYNGWRCVAAASDDADGNVVAGCIDRSTGLPVRANDVFIATAWWSAYLARDLVTWQCKHYGVRHRFAYLIQDYEPGFYPWSSRYALAEATYRHPEEIIAIFNTGILRDYFAHEQYRFDCQHTFEPRLHPALLEARQALPERRKERMILVYGRPGVERNAFPIIVRALGLWQQKYAHAGAWQVVSAGEPHAPIDFGGGRQLVSVGKLPIRGYAEKLDAAAIGISLMVSPHPSYPPLEMASFGVRVITNRYANKDLAKVHDGIVSLPVLEPEALADQLSALCEAYEADAWTNKSHAFAVGDYLEPGELFPFVYQVRKELVPGSV